MHFRINIPAIAPAAISGSIIKSSLTDSAVISPCQLYRYHLRRNLDWQPDMFETLKHERFLFLTRTTPYGGEDPFHLLVKRVEGLTSEEHTKWAEMTGGATTEHGAAGTSGLPSQTD